MIPAIILGLLGVWIGAGCGLLYWGARTGKGPVRRSVSRRVCRPGDVVTIRVAAEPPILEESTADCDVVLLLDHSGSMGAAPGSPLREMIRAAQSFVQRLPRAVRVAVVAFDDSADRICDLSQEKRQAARAIGAITPGGGTFIGGALAQAGEVLLSARPHARRTVVLFSDGFDTLEDVREAADALRAHPSRPTIYSASFGGGETMPLMTAVAGDASRVFLASDLDGLFSLFVALAAEVSGQRAVAALLHEDVNAPRPFGLDTIDGSAPVTVTAGVSTSLMWPLPQFDGVAMPLTYGLQCVCVGWHKVVASRGDVAWRMPDGQVVHQDGALPNRVLVLPWWAIWAWPIANPLLMMLLSPLLGCPAPAARAGTPAMAELPAAALPPALPAPAEAPFQPTVRPALLIGLGRTGVQALETTRGWLREREVPPDRVSFLAVEVGPNIDASRFSEHERILLNADLWPYINGLRAAPVPEARSWIPLRRWFGQGQPLTTMRGAGGDRGKARLTALLYPDRLTKMLGGGAVDQRAGEDRLVALIGAVEEPETTGLLAEIAHILATNGKSATVVLLPVEPGHTEERRVAAFADEMSRLLARRGDQVVSDRGGTPSLARHLFDNVLVVDHAGHGRQPAPEAAAALLWSLLSSRRMADCFPPLELDMARRTDIRFARVPRRTLWLWVREHWIEFAILRGWLGMTRSVDGRFGAVPDQGTVDRLIEFFWSGEIAGRRGPDVLVLAAKTRTDARALLGFLDVGAGQPLNWPYHEQKAFCDRERYIFGHYLEAWCHSVFADAGARGRSGLTEILAAIRAIQATLSLINDHLQNAARDPDVANFASLSASILLEMRALLSRLAGTMDEWEAVLLNPTARPGMAGDHQRPLVFSVLRAMNEADRLKQDWPDFDTHVEPLFKQWLAAESPALLAHLGFTLAYGGHDNSVVPTLRIFDRSLTPGEDVAGTLRAALDRYSSTVLNWATRDWFPANSDIRSDRAAWIGMGPYVRDLYGRDIEVVDDDDPAVAIALSPVELPIRQALGVRVAADPEAYVWSEEANAARIRSLIRNLRQDDTEALTPLAVSLLREPMTLLAFLAEIARGGIQPYRDDIVVERGGRRFTLASFPGQARPLAVFETAADHAVILGLAADGTILPPPSGMLIDPGWTTDDTFRAAFDASPIGQLFVDTRGWQMWRDLARGVFLDHRLRADFG